MEKKQILIVFSIIFIILIVIIFIPKGKNENEIEKVNINISENLSYNYDEETGLYTFYDDEGNKKGETYDSSVLDILKIDPEYDLTLLNPPIENKNQDEENNNNDMNINIEEY